MLIVHNDRPRLIDMAGGDACHRMHTMLEVGAADTFLRVMVDGLRLVGGDLGQTMSFVALLASRLPARAFPDAPVPVRLAVAFG